MNYISESAGQEHQQLHANAQQLTHIFNQVLNSNEDTDIAGIVDNLQSRFIAYQDSGAPNDREKLLSTINELPEHLLSKVIRAFSLYFNLLHIAEESANLKERHQLTEQEEHFWPNSFHDTLLGFKKAGVSADNLQTLLNDLSYMPVMTAHPTEAKRRTIRGALRNVFLSHKKLEQHPNDGYFRHKASERLQNRIQLLWKTDEVRTRNMGVIDEINSGLFYFPLSLFESTAQVYRNLQTAIFDVYGPETAQHIKIPNFLRFGSWIGGDRDGNPNVKPETTVLALRLQALTILQEYIRRVESLGQQLTFSIGLTQPSPEFLESIQHDITLLGELAAPAQRNFQQEPYRHKLALMNIRLKQTLEQIEQRIEGYSNPANAYCYRNAESFHTDLSLMQQSLISHGDQATADLDLLDLIRLVETFGFYLMKLDIRQESTHHTDAVAEILSASLNLDYQSLNETERLKLLGEALATPSVMIYDAGKLSDSARETLRVFEVMAEMHRELGGECFDKYVISMTHQASHILEVAFLASQNGLAGRIGGQWFCRIGISPLFETIEDLSHIDSVLHNLFKQPEYRALIQASGQRQEIMLGYSDSCKDGGIMASAWNLYRAQQQVTAISDEEGIPCIMFHGRGGTIGRGGGPTHEAILAQPPATVRGQIKFTEQGEVLFYRYNNLETAVYELTLGVAGLMKSSLSLVQSVRRDQQEALNIMSELANIGEQSFRDLTERTPDFLDYFYEASPVSEISRLNIGSRPSHRKKQDRSKKSVRAIGWVFAWAQSRQTFPAWYGMGSSLKAWCEDQPDRLETLQTLYCEWPFFRNLLSNAQMALTKSNMSIAREYAALCVDPALGERIHAVIEQEYQDSVEWVLKIAKTDHLIAENPKLAESLRRRNEFLGPLNFIQTVLLRAVRNNPQEHSPLLKPLLGTINAIAAGMRNTG